MFTSETYLAIRCVRTKRVEMVFSKQSSLSVIQTRRVHCVLGFEFEQLHQSASRFSTPLQRERNETEIIALSLAFVAVLSVFRFLNAFLFLLFLFFLFVFVVVDLVLVFVLFFSLILSLHCPVSRNVISSHTRARTHDTHVRTHARTHAYGIHTHTHTRHTTHIHT